MPTNWSTTDLLTADHERGCRGREYECSCGYDAAKDAEIARLRKISAAARVFIKFVLDNGEIEAVFKHMEWETLCYEVQQRGLLAHD